MKARTVQALLLVGLGFAASASADVLISLKASNNQWLYAEGGGGSWMAVNRNSVGTWETFILTDLNGGSINSGDQVKIRTRANGLFLCASNGGGSDIVANRTFGGGWETFTIYKQNGGGSIGSSDLVALKVSNSQWAYANNGGGGSFLANHNSVGTWETFTISISSAPSPLWNTPSYTPTYWNDAGYVQTNNNCYNYCNNRRTDTFAQPGRASGQMYGSLTSSAVGNAAISDGLVPTDASAADPEGKTKVAVVLWPGNDYHCYRKDSNGYWTHKPGQTAATNLDNSGNVITNPETANRGSYSVFVGYYFTPSSSSEGQSEVHIN